MKADKSKMFSVPLQSLKAEVGAPFPLYIFLKLNERFVPIRLPGDALGLEKYERFLNQNHVELWVPNNFQDVYKSYLEYLSATGSPAPQSIEEVIQEIKEQPSGATVHAPKEELKSEEAELASDVLSDHELTTEEKAQVLSAVSQDLLRALNQITTRGEEAREKGLKRCKEIVDEVLNVAAQNSNIYDEILALRNSQEEIEHSVIVGTVAVMFALSIGFSDERILADLTVGAIFHDIGLVRVKPEVLAKKEFSWSAEDRKAYEVHVQGSLDILKESGTEFHQRVFEMVEQHHENYDGSGFPRGLKGSQISETSQLLHLANLFDRLCAGKQTGTALSPKESFDYIYEITSNPKAVQEVQPELVQRIFQFMMNEKEAAENYQQMAENQVKNAIKKNL